MRADAPIAPDSVRVVVTAGDWQDTSRTWWPVNEAGSDGWAAYVPATPWTPGTLVQVRASALSVDGETIGPLLFTFEIAEAPLRHTPVWQPSEAEVDLAGAGLAPAAEATAVHVAQATVPPGLPGSDGPAYTIEDRAFAAPRLVWLPIPASLEPADATLWYFFDDGMSEAGWVPAARMAGWLAEDAYWTVNLGGVDYLGVYVNHGGVVSVAPPPAPNTSAAAVTTGTPWGDLLVLTIVIVMLGVVAPRVRRRARTSS